MTYEDILQLVAWGILVPRNYDVTKGRVDQHWTLSASDELKEALDCYRRELYRYMQERDSTVVE